MCVQTECPFVDVLLDHLQVAFCTVKSFLLNYISILLHLFLIKFRMDVYTCTHMYIFPCIHIFLFYSQELHLFSVPGIAEQSVGHQRAETAATCMDTLNSL